MIVYRDSPSIPPINDRSCGPLEQPVRSTFDGPMMRALITGGLHIVGPHLADVSVLQTMAAFERLFGLEVPPGFGGAIVSASSDR